MLLNWNPYYSEASPKRTVVQGVLLGMAASVALSLYTHNRIEAEPQIHQYPFAEINGVNCCHQSPDVKLVPLPQTSSQPAPPPEMRPVITKAQETAQHIGATSMAAASCTSVMSRNLIEDGDIMDMSVEVVRRTAPGEATQDSLVVTDFTAHANTARVQAEQSIPGFVSYSNVPR